MTNEYQKVKEIGRGAFGKVWLAIHLPTGEQVAIKSIFRHKYEELKLEYPPREISIIKCLNHPHIAKVYQIIEERDRIDIVMEYVSGKCLVDLIPQEGLEEEIARRLFREILLAVEYIHSKGIVHRDLKLDNILVTRSSLEVGTIKIIDFGLSNSYSNNELLTTCCGTTQYAAPELLNGKKYNGPKADVWALGVALYSMIAGDFPFHSSFHTLECKYEIPSYFSSSLQHLLKSIFIVDPKNRTTLRKLMKHPWVNKGYSSSPKQSSKKTSLDPVLIKYLESSNLGIKNVESSILELSSTTTTYFLTLQKLNRLARHPTLVNTPSSPSDPLSYSNLYELLMGGSQINEPVHSFKHSACIIC